jgi:general secretion pathway protein D
MLFACGLWAVCGGHALRAQVQGSVAAPVSSRTSRKAEDIYLDGTRLFSEKKFEAAQSRFERAYRLDPGHIEYKEALLLARETRIRRLIADAAEAKRIGNDAGGAALLEQARALDPANRMVAQHFEPQRPLHVAPKLEGPLALQPVAGARSFHLRGDARALASAVYGGFGIKVDFDPSVGSGAEQSFDVDNVDFARAALVLDRLTGTFAVPVQERSVLIAKDTKELRESMMPLVEETVTVPGATADQLREIAEMGRDLFELNQVSVSSNTGSLVIRGTEKAVRLFDQTYADLINDRSDVLLDLTVYEIDTTKARDIGFAPPTTASAVDVASTAQSLITANQTLLNEAISAGTLKLTSSTYTNELEEVAYLVAAGVSSSSVFTGMLGTIGTYGGVPLGGVSVGSATVNLLLSSTDVRTLEALQLRTSDVEEATFRVGSRYPILTALTTASTSSALAAELAAAGVSSAAIAAAGGTSSTTTVPQIQFEDIGITLKITPRVLSEGRVRLAMEFKLESLAGTGVDGIPILSNRALTSTVTIAAGETSMLATLVSSNETKLLDGVPDLNDIPGFQSTNRDTDGTRNELLITITPHIVRNGAR